MFVHRLKLRPPQLQAAWIERPIAERLIGGVPSVLAIVAGPGYGKTVLATQIYDAWSAAKTWYSLDESDGDLAVFAAHVQTMLAALGPHRGLGGNSWRDGTPKELGSLFADALAERSGALIVFDDVHEIEGSRSREALDEFVQRAARGGATFVLAGRSMPISLHAVAASAQLVTAGTAELAFDKREARAYLHRATGLAAADPVVDRLVQRAEGWPAGLALLASSVAVRHTEATPAISSARDDEARRLLFEYLAAEVLATLTERERHVLLETSILETIDAETCGLVTKTSGAEDVLASLARRGLFVTHRADDAYTVHQLFREFLHDRLQHTHSPEVVAELHRRASVALAARGDDAGAIAHSIDAGDLEAAAAALGKTALPMLAAGRLARVEGFLQRIGRERIEASPALLIALGISEQSRGEFDRALGSLERAIRDARERAEHDVLAEGVRVLAPLLASRGEYARLFELIDGTLALGPLLGEGSRTGLANVRGALLVERERFDEGLAVFNEIMPAVVARGDLALQAVILHNTGVAYFRRGDPYAGLATLERTLKIKHSAGLRVSALLTLGSLIHIMLVLGDVDEAERRTQELLAEAYDIGNATMVAHAYEHEGSLKLQRGDIHGAAQAFREAQRVCDQGDVVVLPAVWHGLARTALALGNLDEVEECCAKATALLRPAGRHQQLAQVLLVRAESALAAGDFEGALALAKEALELSDGADTVMSATIGLEAAALLERLIPGLAPDSADDAERRAAAAAATAVALVHQRDFRFLLRTKAKTLAELHPHLRRWKVGQGLLPDAPRPASSLRIEMLGGLRVIVAGEPLPADAWKRRKARDIFAYLVSLRGRSVPRARLVDLYWPDTDADAAHDNLRVTISAIRKALGDVVKFEANGYRFDAPPNTRVDTEIFDELLERARQALAQGGAEAARHAYMAAVDLYRGEFLEGIDDGGWQWRERERLRAALLEAVRWLANDPAADAAVRRVALARILEAAPFDVEAVRMRLDLMLADSRLNDARQDYEAWKARYRNAVGTDPPEVWPVSPTKGSVVLNLSQE